MARHLDRGSESNVLNAGALLATLIDISPVSIMVHDFEGHFLYFNQKTLDLYGYTRAEFARLNQADLDGPEGGAFNRSRLETLKVGGEISFETQHLRKDGRKITLLVKARAGEWGEQRAILRITTDITKAKQEEGTRLVKEHELQETKERLEYILGITKTGVDIIDEDLNLIYIDPAWQKSYGNPTGRKCYDYFMGRNVVCPTCGIPQALLSKQIAVTEEVLVKEHDRIIEVHTIPFQDSKGKWFVAEYNIDVTERKRKETELKESAEKYRHIFEKASDLIFIIDANLNLLSVSPSVRVILGYEPDEFVGKYFWKSPAIAPGIFERVKAWIEKFQSGSQGELEDYEILSKDGRKVILEILPTPIFKDGRFIALIGIARDVTARRVAEAQVRQVERDQQILLEKTLQLSELKSNLITQAAHELKTPLTSILGWGSVMLAAIKQGKSLDATFDVEDFESIVRNAERLDKIINDFLDMRGIESGNIQLIKQMVDFNEILDNAKQAVDYLATEKGTIIVVEMSPPIHLSIDRRRMEQVFINLLSNAIKYSPEHAQVIVKTGVMETGDHTMFKVQVIDEGYGFTPEEMAEATTAFGKIYARQAQKSVVQGPGLGLYISKRIVEQHGGTLEIQSRGANQGTLVEILLPLLP